MEMNRVVEILNDNGIKAELSSANKSGMEIPCVRIGEGRISPTIYEQTWDEMDAEGEIIEFVRKVLADTPDINIQRILTRDYVLENAISCVRHETKDERTLRFPVYGDLEEYIRIQVDLGIDQHGSIVVLKEHLTTIGIEADELRTAARNNLRKTVSIQSMRAVLAQMMGSAFEDVPALGEEFMFVGTTESKCHGASIILLDDVLSQFCKDHNLASLAIIPSSVNEVILITDEHEESVINNMINEVNATQISDKTEILSNHLYRFVA